MNIVRVTTDAEVRATSRVMRQLRPEVAEEEYVPKVRRMMSAHGYQMAAVIDDRVVKAVGVYRIFETLYCRRLLSIDDLVTDDDSRSAGYGRALLAWLIGQARANDCCHVHLDSRVHRARAHRFYFREGFAIEGFHFIATPLPQPESPGRRLE
ncbi:MAG TPA: GNAT family N-acetyltransferase [Thermoanaerobaculia bacterium]|nr:GNAT family N-acetyltransferase [Thermoanaerobaculia bacterium]